jgi:hypothetical protein
MTPAVLFLIFNRPETTARVFDAIRAARPPRLYVAADGPRECREGEAERCAEARRIATAVDWPCEVKTLFRGKNLGMREAESGGMSWFFENEPEGIILEDDTLPVHSFFGYCKELLAKYRDDERVMCIAGDNTVPGCYSGASSYLFSAFPLTWGWATWQRAWRHYAWSGFLNSDRRAVIESVFSDPYFVSWWQNIFDETARGDVNTWDYVWVFNVWSQAGLTCVPEANLIKNIGFGEHGTHTKNPLDPRANARTDEIQLPLKHPVFVCRNMEFDRNVVSFIHRIRPPVSLKTRVLRRLRRMMRWS